MLPFPTLSCANIIRWLRGHNRPGNIVRSLLLTAYLRTFARSFKRMGACSKASRRGISSSPLVT
jgi:hypothetical protein